MLGEADLAVLDLHVRDAGQALFAGLLGHGMHGVVQAGVPGQLVAVGYGADLLLALLDQLQALGGELVGGFELQGLVVDGAGVGGLLLQRVAGQCFLQVAIVERLFPGGGVGLAVDEAFDLPPDTSCVDDRAGLDDICACLPLGLNCCPPVADRQPLGIRFVGGEFWLV
ncbi:hypothetical protein Y695_03026 [Hydrogenophaga sp. T4]|nr:hypothetical protein Y695_03026 [Hydrogenophaga sp. T4]